MTLIKIGWLASLVMLSLSAQVPNFTPPTPLMRAAMRNETAEVKRLLAAGANPNEGRIIGMTPVLVAVINRNVDMVRALIDKGADIKATDANGSTTLMWAAANETGKPELVQELLKLHVDPRAKNNKGETALDWAMQRGYTPIVETLLNAGAPEPKRIRESVESATALLQQSGVHFTKVSGCASCHHQSLPQMVVGAARRRGFAVNEEISKQQVAAVIAMFKPMREPMLNGTEAIPDTAITVSYALLGLHAEGYAPNDVTEAMAHVVAAHQLADGSFPAILMARPPMESSAFTATALSLRALQLYGNQPDTAVARAREWLRRAKPQTNEERAMQLLGLAWAKASSGDLKSAARAMIAEQRPDGGWAQLATLETDAYATGQALVALHEAGYTRDAAYQQGIAFLLRTQLSDGSWLVRSRSIPVQQYKDSGFPHGKHQWISASGTSWAAMALSLSEPETTQIESRTQPIVRRSTGD